MLAFHEADLGLDLPKEAVRVDPVGGHEVLVQAGDAAGQVGISSW
jgi:hypothetical protein